MLVSVLTIEKTSLAEVIKEMGEGGSERLGKVKLGGKFNQ